PGGPRDLSLDARLRGVRVPALLRLPRALLLLVGRGEPRPTRPPRAHRGAARARAEMDPRRGVSAPASMTRPRRKSRSRPERPGAAPAWPASPASSLDIRSIMEYSQPMMNWTPARVVDLRRRLGLTAAEMGGKLGVAASTITRYETGFTPVNAR